MVITDDGLLAVTDSGNLLRFDLKDLRLRQEIQPDAAIALLTAAKGIGVLAACADGRVFRIDPKTLRQTEFAKLPAAPRWMVGFRDASKQQDGVLAVVPSGDDEIEPPEGVYGFVELPDGQVWAYGGTMHMGHCSGFIARVDRGKLEDLGSFRSGPAAGIDTPPTEPRYPITHVIPDPAGDGLFVFACDDLFGVDAKLTNWRRLGGIELRYRWGRPDAVGSYPALRTVLAVEDRSGDLICTTARDGLLRIRDGRVTQHVVPGQIGDDRIDTVLPASGATLLVGEDLWRRAAGSWQATSLFPPAEPSPRESWHEYGLMLDPDRRPVALCQVKCWPSAGMVAAGLGWREAVSGWWMVRAWFTMSAS
jgi:hypothetical protein